MSIHFQLPYALITPTFEGDRTKTRCESLAKETQHKLEARSMVNSPSQRILTLPQLHGLLSTACSNRDLGSTVYKVIKSNVTAYLSQRGDVSYLILRELNKGSLTLSTEA